jgi:hypothetical protein
VGVGLANLGNYICVESVIETAVAYAGMGDGRCEHWHSICQYEDEDLELKIEQALAFPFTQGTFSVSNPLILDAHMAWKDDQAHFYLGIQI